MTSKEVNPNRHKPKFRRWQSRCPAATRFLSEEIEHRFVPLCSDNGYEWVDVWLRDRSISISGNEIVLEKCSADHISYVYIAFDKRLSPRFQILCAKRSISSGNEFIHSGNLVEKSGEYYHFWGKPWWVPLSMWFDTNSINIVSKVVSIGSQIFPFLESGERGPNIGRSVHVNR